MRGVTDPAEADLEAEQPAVGRGDADRPAAVAAGADRHHADRDRGRRATRRPAGCALRVPRVARDAVDVGARPVDGAVLRRRREPDQHRARRRGAARPRWRCGRRCCPCRASTRACRASPRPRRAPSRPWARPPTRRGPRPARPRRRSRTLDARASSTSRKQNALSSSLNLSTRARKWSSSSTARSSPLRTPSASSHASRSHSFRHDTPRSRRELRHLRERVLDPAREHLEIARRVAVGPQPEVQRAVVRQDADDDRQVLRERHDRVRLDQPSAHHVERLLRPGHVGDDEVHERLPVHGARREAHQRRRDVVAHVEQADRRSAPAASP